MKSKGETIKIKEVSTKYILEAGDKRISATKDCNGKISLYVSGYFNRSNFIFKNTSPDMIKSVAELFIAASKL